MSTQPDSSAPSSRDGSKVRIKEIDCNSCQQQQKPHCQRGGEYSERVCLPEGHMPHASSGCRGGKLGKTIACFFLLKAPPPGFSPKTSPFSVRCPLATTFHPAPDRAIFLVFQRIFALFFYCWLIMHFIQILFVFIVTLLIMLGRNSAWVTMFEKLVQTEEKTLSWTGWGTCMCCHQIFQFICLFCLWYDFCTVSLFLWSARAHEFLFLKLGVILTVGQPSHCPVCIPCTNLSFLSLQHSSRIF